MQNRSTCTQLKTFAGERTQQRGQTQCCNPHLDEQRHSNSYIYTGNKSQTERERETESQRERGRESEGEREVDEQ